jgi:hypothetical protein
MFESELSCFNKSIKIILQSMDVQQWGSAHSQKVFPLFLVKMISCAIQYHLTIEAKLYDT